jgi:repressor LexA
MAGRPPGKTTQITPTQRLALEAIRDFIRERRYGPSRAELAERLGIKPPSAHHLVAELARKGFIRWDRETARGITIVRFADPVGDGEEEVPILGTVAAGQPIFSEENVIGSVRISAELARRGRCFALQVRGESMFRAGIAPGDHVVVRQQPMAAPGEIVVALVAGEATIKTLFVDDEVIELRPENPDFPVLSIQPDDDLRIVGKVVSVIHRTGPGRNPE